MKTFPFEQGKCYVARFLWNIAADRCQRAAREKVDNPQGAGWSDALAAIVFAAMSVEAFVNETSELVSDGLKLSGAEPATPQREQFLRAAAMVFQLEEDRASVVAKALMFSALLPGRRLSVDAEPLQGVTKLFRMRNDIVHPKVRATPAYVREFMARGMTVDGPDDYPQLAGWIFQIQNPLVAAWGCKVARSLVFHLLDQLGTVSDDEYLSESIVAFQRFGWETLARDARVDS